MIPSRYARYIPALLLFLGAVLRIATLGAASLWYDEAVTLYRTGLPFMSLGLDRSEYSGCLLLDLLVRPLMAVDHSVILLRLPALLASLACLWMVYLLMRRLQFNLLQQSITAAFVAFLPGILWMSTDARAYSLLSALGLAALLFALDGKYLGLLAVAGLSAYAHRTGPALMAPAFLLALTVHRSDWKRIAVTAVLTGLAWVPSFVSAWWFTSTQDFWALGFSWGRLYGTVLNAFVTNTFPGLTFLLPAVVVASALPFVFRTGNRLALLGWLMPLTLMVLVSIVWQNVIIYRTLMPLLYPFGLWLGCELGRRPVRIYQAVSLCLWAGMLLMSAVSYNPADRGGGIAQAADTVRAGWQSGDVIVYTTFTTQAPFDYYLHDLDAYTWSGVQNPFLTPPDLQVNMTPPVAPLRLWVITAHEPTLMTAAEQAAIADMISGGVLAASVQAPQFAPIDIWLVEK